MRRFEYALALLAQLVGAAGALLVAARTWQTVTTPRPDPLGDDVLGLSGRTVDAAPTALALVALAGIVAVVATRGAARRVVGVVVALAGAGLIWRALSSAGAVGTARARSLVTVRHRTVDADSVVPHVVVHGAWPALTVVCGLLVLLAGLLAAARGHRWRSLSARYEQPGRSAQDGAEVAVPPSPVEGPARAADAPALWTALDRGDDPTSDPAPRAGAAPAEDAGERPAGNGPGPAGYSQG